MDRATLHSSRFLSLAAVAAAGLLGGCVPDYTSTYDPRIDGLSPPQVASAELGILDDQKSRPHITAATPVAPKPAAPAPAAPPVSTPPNDVATPPPTPEGTTAPAPVNTTPPPPPADTAPTAPPPAAG